MNILGVGLGSFGDVLNVATVGDEIRRNGHSFSIICDPHHQDKLSNLDIQFVNPNLSASLALGSAGDSPRKTIFTPNEFLNFYQNQAEAITEAALSYQSQVDLVITSGGTRQVERFHGKFRAPVVVLITEPVKLSPHQKEVLEDSWRAFKSPLLIAVYDAKVFEEELNLENLFYSGFFQHTGNGCTSIKKADIGLSLGSMETTYAQQCLTNLSQVITEMGLTAWRLGSTTLPISESSIQAHPRVILDIALDNCDLLIHHGGLGTIGHVLRKSKPNIIVPQFQMQSNWANQLHKLKLCEYLPEPTPILIRQKIESAKQLQMANASKFAHNGISSSSAKIQEIYQNNG